uniref:C-type lectin domain-containing protein n=1 Tax=Xiphophorus maculatus TaxID=8083 RepID=A0A3B5Q0E4_XIPMA
QLLPAQCCFIDCQLYEFHYINENKNWTEAQQYCREKHTDLATVTNMKDMKRLINISAGYNTAAWIGLYDQTNGTRTWFWSLPELEFNESETNWNPGEPSDKGIQGSENCGAVYQDLTWLDDGCQKTKYFLCYDDNVILINQNKTWEDALTYCRENHHDLVTITNMDDQRWIQEKVKKASTDYVWTGLHYACTLDLWFWVSDEMVIYKNWAEGEPMDDCDMSGAMETKRDHQWFKRNDSDLLNFICSKE